MSVGKRGNSIGAKKDPKVGGREGKKTLLIDFVIGRSVALLPSLLE